MDLEGEGLASLIRLGIHCTHEKSKRFWVIDVEMLPIADSSARQDVRKRIAEAHPVGTPFPETRDIMAVLVSIAEPCEAPGLRDFRRTADQTTQAHSNVM